MQQELRKIGKTAAERTAEAAENRNSLEFHRNGRSQTPLKRDWELDSR